MLFIDARHTYRQVDRAHRDFLPEQIELLANIVRLYRGENVETVAGSEEPLKERFPDGRYVDVPGLCKVAHWPRSRRKDGVSAPAVTPVWQRWTMMTRTSAETREPVR